MHNIIIINFELGIRHNDTTLSVSMVQTAAYPRLPLLLPLVLTFGACSGSFPSANSGGGMAYAHAFSRPGAELTSKGGSDDLEVPSSAIRNFRQAACLRDVYRCGSTDDLSGVKKGDSRLSDPESPESILLRRAGLILDLRSASERDEEKARKWMAAAPGGPFSFVTFMRDSGTQPMVSAVGQGRRRIVNRIDVLSPSRLFAYLSENWLSPAQKILSAIYFAVDTGRLHELRMDVLNERGLAGLYEAIVRTSEKELAHGLVAITEHFEADPNRRPVAVHCVQGKDRTGLLIMLCQSIIGVSDEEIISDYHVSSKLRKIEDGSAAAEGLKKLRKIEDGSVAAAGLRKGKLDRRVFSGAPKEAMVETMGFIRRNYGSICPGYLDAIGFDDQWRLRFVNALSTRTGKSAEVEVGSLPKSRL